MTEEVLAKLISLSSCRVTGDSFRLLAGAIAGRQQSLNHLHNTFLGGASLQPSALCNKHHPKNIPTREEASTGKGLEGRAKRREDVVLHGN